VPLTDNDIKSELSYAYLHAVAARAGCECQVTQRHSDNRGIDARLMASGEFATPPSLTQFDVYIQLKATSQQLRSLGSKIPFDLEVEQYDKLRVTTAGNPWLLILLRMPAGANDWLRCSPQALTLKRCAYWVSLYGAAASTNRETQRVYIPQRNRFTAEALTNLLTRFAREETVAYEG
jgi:hypothetical protein